MFNCSDFSEKISMYIDNELDDEDKIAFDKHLEVCENCRKEYEIFCDIINIVQNVEQVELPENFHDDFMIKLKTNLKDENVKIETIEKTIKNKLGEILSIKEHQDNTKKYFSYFSIKRLLPAVACFVLFMVIFVSGNSIVNEGGLNNNKSDLIQPENSFGNEIIKDDVGGFSSKMASFSVEEDNLEISQEEVISFDLKGPSNDLIIQYNLNIEVEDFEATIGKIQSLDGTNTFYSQYYKTDKTTDPYQPNNNQVTIKRLLNYDLANNFLNQIKSFGKISNMNQSSQNVSYEILELQARIKAKETELTRLTDLVLLSDTVAVLRSLQQRINEVEYEINSLKGSLRNYNSENENVVFNINIYEKNNVSINQEKTFLIKLKNAFSNSINNTFAFFQAMLILALRISVPLVIVIAILISLKFGFRRGRNQK